MNPYRLEPCALWRRTETENAWAEAEDVWERAGTVRCDISAGTGGGLTRVNDLLRMESTHTGATWDAVQVGDRLRPEDDEGGGTGYEVLYVVNGGMRKMHQLYMKKVEWVCGST